MNLRHGAYAADHDISTRRGHQITGDDLDVSCECGWYNHDPDRAADRSATAHVIRAVVGDPGLADDYEADYRERWS